MDMFIAVFWSYGQWYVWIVMKTLPLVDHSVVKVWILALPAESTLDFGKGFLKA